MMNFESTRFRIENISEDDDLYRITLARDLDSLIRSINSLGVLNPPIIEQTAGRFRLVTGFRRVAACRRLGWEDFDARILQPSRGELDCLKIAIADNAFSRHLNVLEEARAVIKLSAHITDPLILCEIATSLGIPVNPQLADKYRRLCRLPEPAPQHVASGTIPLAVALELERLESSSAIAVADLFNILQPTLNQQRELLSGIRDIASLEGKKLSELIGEPFISELIEDGDLDRKQKVGLLRSATRKRRFPTLSIAEAQFHDHRKKLNLPRGLTLQAPNDFESPDYNFILTFRSIEELAQHAERLGAISRDTELHAILKRDIEHP